MKRCRWITIGVVRVGHFARFAQWGCPNAFLMIWAGRVSVFQSIEFLQWEHLQEAIRRRLHRARLAMVAIAWDVQRSCVGFGGLCNPEGKWQTAVRVLVTRSKEFLYE